VESIVKRDNFAEKNIRNFLLCALILGLCFSNIPFSFSQLKTPPIKWYSFEEALELAQKSPKKIFIDVYTDWCGWCKKMDATTFVHDTIVSYINQHFYAAKLNAERKDTVVINGSTFINPSPNTPRSAHQLAAALLQNRLSYPSFVFLNEEGQMISVVPGYMVPQAFEPVLHYFGDNSYLNQKWEEFKLSFKGTIE